MEMLFTVLVLLFFARVGAEIAERMNQSSLLGEIAGGLVAGPSVLGIIKPDGGVSDFLELGGILLLFLIGLNTRMDEMQDDLFDSLVLGVAGQVVSFAVIFLAAHYLLGFASATSAFLGAIFSSSSTSVVVRTLIDINRFYTKVGKLLTSLSFVDDFVGIVIFAIAATFFSNTALNTGEIWKLILTVIGFITILTTVGSKIIPHIFDMAEKMLIKESLVSFSLIICFGIALLAHQIGIALIIGAFLAGMVINKSPFINPTVAPKLSAIAYGFFIPMFFANIGVSTSVESLSSGFWMFAALAVIVIASKFIPLYFTAGKLGYKSRDSFLIASGMLPRAEYTLILASVGLGIGVVEAPLFSVVVLVTIFTTLISPVLIKRGFDGDGKY